MRRFVKIKALLLLILFFVAGLSVVPSIARVLGEEAEAKLPAWLTSNYDRAFTLGLDLQGGLHLEYSVAVDEALENKLDRVAGELEGAFREKKPDTEVTVERRGIDEIVVTFADPSQMSKADDDVMGITFGLLEREHEDTSAGTITLKVPEDLLTQDRTAIVGQALETVRRRVDAMGIAEPNIYPKNRQIVLELPGLTDTSTEVRAAADEASEALVNLLKQGGAVQVVVGDIEADPGAFTLTLPDSNAREVLDEVFGAKIITTDKGKTIIDERIGAEVEIRPDDAGAAPDPAVVSVALTEAARDEVLEESSDFRRLLKVVERAAVLEMHMVDEETPYRDTGEPYLKALYEGRMVTEGMGISVNVEPDYGREGGAQVTEPYAYYAKECKTLKRFFNNLPAEWRLPSTHAVAYGLVPVVTRRNAEPEHLCKTYVIKARADITGDRIVNANVGFKDDTGTPQVEVAFDKLGATAFDEMSGANVGRRMAIIMDELVVSDPVFNERISGGNVVITLGNAPGESVRDQANDLVKVLKSGSLPARLQKEFEIRVGADLGKDSVERGFQAFAAGLIAVVLFMGIYYRRGGVVAVFALIMNVVLILASMAFFRATLTLPGIAGIVLTLGMAVDANVIIFERMRDLLREGYKARAAIEAGYDRAFSTILDSQLTTAIAGVVLWQFGSGPIRGFAITLLIGIVTSIFTGVFATRVFFDWQANRRGFDKVSI